MSIIYRPSLLSLSCRLNKLSCLYPHHRAKDDGRTLHLPLQILNNRQNMLALVVGRITVAVMRTIKVVPATARKSIWPVVCDHVFGFPIAAFDWIDARFKFHCFRGHYLPRPFFLAFFIFCRSDSQSLQYP